MAGVGRLVRWLVKGENASDYKARVDAQLAVLEEESAELSGKEHQKERAAKGKEAARLRAEPHYVDACRVVKGLLPVHGFFKREGRSRAGSSSSVDSADAAAGEGEPSLDPANAAKLASEAEKALAELQPPEEAERRVLPATLTPEDVAALFGDWKKRAGKLEAKIAADLSMGSTSTVAGIGSQEVDELEQLAQEVVDYRDRLRTTCGYSHKDFKEDPELSKFEDRLDRLSARLSESQQAVSQRSAFPGSVAELEARERSLASSMFQHLEQTAGLCPSEVREVKQLIREVAELKAKLRADGMPEHQQDKEKGVLTRLVRLSEIRMKEHHDKTREKNNGKVQEADLAELEKLQEELAALRREFRDEGGSAKDLKQDPMLCELEERLAVLKRFGGA